MIQKILWAPVSIAAWAILAIVDALQGASRHDPVFRRPKNSGGDLQRGGD